MSEASASSDPNNNRQLFRYRITGPHSVARLDPLVLELGGFEKCSESDSESPLDFVWETYCEKAWKKTHDGAKVLNRLHNTQILEDKASLAFLQLRVQVPMLDTFIASNSQQVLKWCSSRWTNNEALSENNHNFTEQCIDLETSFAKVSFLNEPHSWSVPFDNFTADDIVEMDLADWWALKASRGNGGRDVWVVNRFNYTEVLATVPTKDEYILQRYVPRPLLWHNKKFHFRCYSLLRADMSSFLYEKGFIICAGVDYTFTPPSANQMDRSELPDMNKHLTNLSINKTQEGHPGLVPCLMSEECPQIFQKVSAMWQAVAHEAAPFMREQRSPHHFEFFGIDVMADATGEVWLIEINRVPGLETSRNRCHSQEEAMFDEMMRATLQMILAPLQTPFGSNTSDINEYDKSDNSTHQSTNNTGNGSVFRIDELSRGTPAVGFWRQVGGPAEDTSAPSPFLFKNLFNWKAFTSKNKSKLFV